MEEEFHLPYKSVVLFIACGCMMFAIVFIFAKRQITRFALRSNRVPHAAIGANVPKNLKQKIEQRLNRVGEIVSEPALMSPFLKDDSEQKKLHFYHRMRTVDNLKTFEREMIGLFPKIRRKVGQETLRTFLLEQRQNKYGCLNGIQLETIDKFASIYEHARHDPAEFREEHYQEFIDLMNQLIEYMKNQSQRTNHTDDSKPLETPPMTLPLITNSTPSIKSSSTATLSKPSTTPVSSQKSSVHEDGNRYCHTPELGKTRGFFQVEDSRLGYRQRSVGDEEESGLLLESQDSGSTQSSLTDSEVTFRRVGKQEGQESYV